MGVANIGNLIKPESLRLSKDSVKLHACSSYAAGMQLSLKTF